MSFFFGRCETPVLISCYKLLFWDLYLFHFLISYALSVGNISMYLAGHLGRDKTTQKIADRFYWKNLWNDAREFVQQCDICQRTNDAKFQKQAAPLHPIPVKSKVWNQVCRVTRLTRVYCISTNRLYSISTL